MKLFAKIGIFALVAGAGTAALYADPGSMGGLDDPSAQARVSHVQAVRQQGADDVRHVLHLQETARTAKDVIRLNCVNDKLVQMRPLLNVLDRLQVEVQTDAGAMAEVNSTGENVRRLREDADGCGGEALLSGDSENSFTAPTVPDSPFGEPWTETGTIIEPPGYASPFN